ncbi:hypothetical protein QZH41_009356, partial [Actinostola sp. cb2023]
TEGKIANSTSVCVAAPDPKKICQDLDLKATQITQISSVVVNDVSNSSPTIYGMLIVLGYNGKNPNGVHARQKSNYILKKRVSASGVKPFRQYLASSDTGKQVLHSNKSHSVSYTIDRGQSVVVEYCKDEKTDMFQIGRSSDSKIDFVILDTIPGPKRPGVVPNLQKSTISRYACRITVDRQPPHTARVFAAGFDATNNIFSGEKAAKWQNDQHVMDGLTTNGVLHMNPKGGSNCPAGIWREISVCGNVYTLRETRSSTSNGKPMCNESNILMDGSLIDLCGAVLMWRTEQGMKEIPSEGMIDAMRRRLNAMRPQCPVGLTTLVFPTSSTENETLSRQPHVYIKCGHVHGFHGWNSPNNRDQKSRTCPICLQMSNYVPLQIGHERAFYEGEIVPTHAFVPCGHVCSEATVSLRISECLFGNSQKMNIEQIARNMSDGIISTYFRTWSQIPIPHGCDAFQAICPFCVLPLEDEDGFSCIPQFVQIFNASTGEQEEKLCSKGFVLPDIHGKQNHFTIYHKTYCSVYSTSEHNNQGLIICNLPYGVLIASHASNQTSTDAVRVVENACRILRT